MREDEFRGHGRDELDAVGIRLGAKDRTPVVAVGLPVIAIGTSVIAIGTSIIAIVA
jgi:hypothetical protein